MNPEDFKDGIRNMFEDAEAVAVRRDIRANIGIALFIIAGAVMFLVVMPFIGAGVYIAGKGPR